MASKKGANTARTLEPEASAALRDQLIAQLKALNSAEEAADWAHRVLASKNSLVLTDAKQVELAFQLKLSALMPDQPTVAEQPEALRRRRRGRDRATSVNKTILALPVPRRIRDREHVKSVAKQPCLVCGRRPADAHHLRFAQSSALGRKVSDEFTVPLCRGHHREVHRYGDEAAWWENSELIQRSALGRCGAKHIDFLSQQNSMPRHSIKADWYVIRKVGVDRNFQSPPVNQKKQNRKKNTRIIAGRDSNKLISERMY